MERSGLKLPKSDTDDSSIILRVFWMPELGLTLCFFRDEFWEPEHLGVMPYDLLTLEYGDPEGPIAVEGGS